MKLLHILLQNKILAGIFLLSLFLRLYRLHELAPFIGDQAWFYLSSRDMLLTGNIPLVGITSSHTWLHQGSLWTYILAVFLFLGKYNPLAPVYITAVISSISILLVYAVVRKYFDTYAAMLATVLYVTSPLIIIHARMAYHTVFIPLIVILLYFVITKWVQGNVKYFAWIGLLLGVLYNFELASVVFFFIPLFLFLIGLYFQKPFVTKLKNKKVLLFSLFGLLIPMLPILIYDISHEFRQTIIFAGWMVYKLISFFVSEASSPSSWSEMGKFLAEYTSRIIFLPHQGIAVMIMAGSIGKFIHILIRKRNNISVPLSILALFFFIPLLGFLVSKTPSEAYLPMLFFQIFALIAVTVTTEVPKKYMYGVSGIVCLIIIGNIFMLIQKDYFMGKYSGYGPLFTDKINVSTHMVKSSNGRKIEIQGVGQGSEFTSFIMPYTYLTWYLTDKKVKSEGVQIFQLEEKEGKILLKLLPPEE